MTEAEQIASCAAEKIVAYIALPDSAGPDDSTGSPTEYITTIITRELAPLVAELEVADDALDEQVKMIAELRASLAEKEAQNERLLNDQSRAYAAWGEELSTKEAALSEALAALREAECPICHYGYAEDDGDNAGQKCDKCKPAREVLSKPKVTDKMLCSDCNNGRHLHDDFCRKRNGMNSECECKHKGEES